MIIKFWGVQGSYPYVSVDKKSFHTPCVSIETEEALIVFDGGSGLSVLDLYYKTTHKPVYLFLSHFHFDHISGLLSFSKLFVDDASIILVHPNPNQVKAMLDSLFNTPFFPLSRDSLRCSIDIQTPEQLSFASCQIECHELKHTGKAYAYKLSVGDKSVVYATDNELDRTNKSSFFEFIKKSTVLIHDAHFYKEDRDKYKGWGHSFVDDVCAFSDEAMVEQLVLFHHNPKRSVDSYRELKKYISKTAKSSKFLASIELSYDGMEIDF
ncbi:hypothetical protein DID78_04365 [Candidatus Marinamargulisbacteria bacterium SCGC AG-343-D04]|nr:hypothetical protein DID78_04365 [Candidatus Marinamargulisbacteria bacterium SCGC AG-343-D04]